MTLINSRDIVFFMKVFPFRTVELRGESFRWLISSEDLKEREEVLVSDTMIAEAEGNS